MYGMLKGSFKDYLETGQRMCSSDLIDPIIHLTHSHTMTPFDTLPGKQAF